ncbi:synaptonemal complex protein 2-like [Huso huso]|uniref:Synaptonemal complex protein 2-like n=1 Tax=Huso huso TaxID=61971 RepID=A0ABR0ZJS7_HUSHU
MVNLESLEEAVSSNNIQNIVEVLQEEWSSKTILNRLDKLANKELDKNDFRNVALLLKGIQCFCMNEFKSALSLFIQQGLVLKISIVINTGT